MDQFYSFDDMNEQQYNKPARPIYELDLDDPKNEDQVHR
jgi:hypothetical protein